MVDDSADIGLVSRTLKGDKEAFRLLVEKYEGKVYALAYEMLRSKEDARDISQESFVKAYLSLKDFRGEGTFYTWLYRIVYNMVLDYKRKIVRRGGQHDELDETTPGQPGSWMGVVEAPHESLIRREQREHLKRALADMSEEHRAVIVLREVDGLSYDEIAQVTGVSRGTVMSRLHYARKKLQGALSFIYPEYGASSKGGSENSGGGEEEGQDGYKGLKTAVAVLVTTRKACINDELPK